MALTSDDYLDIVNAIIECVHLKEQQESTRKIREKLEQLNEVRFESNIQKQKTIAIIIARLKFSEKRLLYKATIVDPLLTDTWNLLAGEVKQKILVLSKQKKDQAKLF